MKHRILDGGLILLVLVIAARESLASSTRRTSRRIATTERGASLVEYALLVALIAVVCIGAVTVLGSNASAKYSKIGSAVGS